MTITRRILSLLLAAALLFPCGALAEAYVLPAGEVTTTAISDAYAYGMQLNATVAFGLDAGEGAHGALVDALDALLRKAKLTLSFYDDFGTARVRGALTVGETTLASGDAQIFEDGSAQIVTSLTGNSVLTLPAGTITESGIDLTALTGGPLPDVDIEDPAFAALSTRDRFTLALEDMQLTVLNHVLGWISSTQRATGDLYVFDEEPVEATDTRDAVDQRMVCTIRGWDFCQLFVNILTTTRDERGQFLQATADMLASLGVTRYQVRQVIDGLFTEEQLDPAYEWIQPSATVYDDGALCTFDDVNYACRKMLASADLILGNSSLAEIKFTLCYDENGEVVGIDLDVPDFSELTPYEGDFVYSVKTNPDETRRHTAHGELEVFGDQRVVGDLTAVQGADVDGVNASSLSVTLDMLHHADGSTSGGAFDADATFTANDERTAEQFAAEATFSRRANGETTPVAALNIAGETTVADEGFSLEATASAKPAGGLPGFVAGVTLDAGEFDGEAFPAGETADLTVASVRDAVKQRALGELLGAYISLSSDPDVMAALSALVPAE